MKAEILTEAQRAVLKRFAELPKAENFYLAGGTATALHLGHRESIDFDFFTPNNFSSELLLAEIRGLGLLTDDERLENNTLLGYTQNVKFSFFKYPYKLISEAIFWEEYNCDIANLPDLCAMKLLAIAQRGTRKDFIDIYAIQQATDWDLNQMFDYYREKFATKEIAHLLYGLSYFVDAEQEPQPKMFTPVDWSEIKSAISRWVVSYR